MAKVLIVDDDAQAQKAYKTKLESQNWQVTIADNGKLGLALAKKEKPDVILLDVLMPRMGGVEFLEKLDVKNLKYKPIIIVLTNSVVPSDTEARVRRLGAKDYLVKANISINNVTELINKYIAEDLTSA